MKKRILALFAALLMLLPTALAACGEDKPEGPVFNNPDDRFNYVVDEVAKDAKKAIEELPGAETAASGVGQTDVTLSLNIHQGLIDLLKLVLSQSGGDLDLSFLNRIEVSFSTKKMNDLCGLFAGLQLGQTNILCAGVQYEDAGKAVFVTCDPLLDKALMFSSEQPGLLSGMTKRDDLWKALGSLDSFSGALDAGGLFDKVRAELPSFFGTTADADHGSVSQSEKEVTVEGVAEKQIAYSVSITPDTIVAGLKKLAQIPQFKQAVSELSPELLSWFEDPESKKDQLPDISVVVYATEGYELRGVEIGIVHKEKSYGTYIANYAENEGKYGFRLSATGVGEGGHSILVTSSGEVENKRLTGTFNAKYDDARLFSFTLTGFDREAIRSGKLIGKVSMRANDFYTVVERFADTSKFAPYAPYLSLLGEVTLEGGEDGLKAALCAPKKKDGTADELISAAISVKSSETTDLKPYADEYIVPGDTTELLSALTGLETLLQRLGEAGLPVEALSSLLGSAAIPKE